MADQIRVKAPGEPGEDGGARVVLSERDKAHVTKDRPDGTVFIVEGDGPISVGLTPLVAERLRDGRLEQTGGPKTVETAQP